MSQCLPTQRQKRNEWSSERYTMSANLPVIGIPIAWSGAFHASTIEYETYSPDRVSNYALQGTHHSLEGKQTRSKGLKPDFQWLGKGSSGKTG